MMKMAVNLDELNKTQFFNTGPTGTAVSSKKPPKPKVDPLEHLQEAKGTPKSTVKKEASVKKPSAQGWKKPKSGKPPEKVTISEKPLSPFVGGKPVSKKPDELLFDTKPDYLDTMIEEARRPDTVDIDPKIPSASGVSWSGPADPHTGAMAESTESMLAPTNRAKYGFAGDTSGAVVDKPLPTPSTKPGRAVGGRHEYVMYQPGVGEVQMGSDYAPDVGFVAKKYGIDPTQVRQDKLGRVVINVGKPMRPGTQIGTEAKPSKLGIQKSFTPQKSSMKVATEGGGWKHDTAEKPKHLPSRKLGIKEGHFPAPKKSEADPHGKKMRYGMKPEFSKEKQDKLSAQGGGLSLRSGAYGMKSKKHEAPVAPSSKKVVHDPTPKGVKDISPQQAQSKLFQANTDISKMGQKEGVKAPPSKLMTPSQFQQMTKKVEKKPISESKREPGDKGISSSVKPVLSPQAPIYSSKVYTKAAPDVKMALSGAAKKYKIPEHLIMAMAQQESGFNPGAVSPKGAIGTIQVMPNTAAGIAKQLGVSDYDMKNPQQNAEFGAYFMKQKLNQFGGNPYLALAAYNGPAKDVQAMIQKWQGRTDNGDWSDLSKVSKEQVLKGLSTWRKDPKRPTEPPETYKYVRNIGHLIG